jgi:hypothetical protein
VHFFINRDKGDKGEIWFNAQRSTFNVETVIARSDEIGEGDEAISKASSGLFFQECRKTCLTQRTPRTQRKAEK